MRANGIVEQQRIIAVGQDKRIGATAAVERVEALVEFGDRLDLAGGGIHRRGAGRPDVVGKKLHNVVAVFAPHKSAPEPPETYRPPTRRIVAGPAIDNVVAGPPVQNIVARAPFSESPPPFAQMTSSPSPPSKKLIKDKSCLPDQ